MILRLLFSLLAVCAVGLSQTCNSVSLSSGSTAQSASGTQNGTFTATGNPANCLRTATSDSPWITVVNGPAGGTSNPVTFIYTVGANNSPAPRTGLISVNNGQATFTVSQSGVACTYTLNPATDSVPGTGGPGSTNLNTGSSCSWTAVVSDPWVTLTSPSSGSGNSVITYNIDPNPTSGPRTATITIGTAVLSINQSAACSFTVAPAFATVQEKAATGTLSITANATTCTRTAVSDSTWLTISSGATGTGNGTVGYAIQANTTPTTRTGHITINDATFTVTQNGANCNYAISPGSKSFPSVGGTGAFNLTTTCSWTVSVSDPWIFYTGATSGTGNASFSYNVASNTTAQLKNGSILVGTGQHFVSLAAASCSVTLGSSTMDVPSAGLVASLTVNAFQGCNWTATSNASWITLSQPASGSGAGTLAFTAAPNTTPISRSGTISIANQLFTVTQPGASCDYAIDPASASISSGAYTGNISVTTACNWSAVSSATWLAITSGAATTTGSGTASYSVPANSTATARSATIKIATQTFSLTQAGAVCNLTLATTSGSLAGPATSGRFSVNGSAAGCTWTPVSNVPWITISGFSSISGSGAVDFAVEMNPTVSPRTGTITVGSLTYTVTQAGSVPAITAAGIVNAASFKAGPVSAGEIITIYGTLVGTTPLTTLQLNAAKNGLVNNLGATRVLFDGVAAPIVYSSATQTSAIVPYSVAGKTTTSVTVEYQGTASNAVTLNVATASPAVFALDSSGTGPGAILNQDFSLNAATNAAARGTIVQIFATGEGATKPAGVDGQLAVVPLPAPTQTVTVKIGNIDAPVVYSGAAPGLVAGVIQINARVPATAPLGAAVPVVVRVGTTDSPAGITIAVK